MERKYSVFIFNVASCSDRYCSAYGPEFTMEQMFDRVKSIPLLTAVDLVLNPMFIKDKDRIVENVQRTGLKVASVAVDTFANPVYSRGSFSAIDESVRRQAIADAKGAIDFARRVNCNIMTTWPGLPP